MAKHAYSFHYEIASSQTLKSLQNEISFDKQKQFNLKSVKMAYIFHWKITFSELSKSSLKTD